MEADLALVRLVGVRGVDELDRLPAPQQRRTPLELPLPLPLPLRRLLVRARHLARLDLAQLRPLAPGRRRAATAAATATATARPGRADPAREPPAQCAQPRVSRLRRVGRRRGAPVGAGGEPIEAAAAAVAAAAEANRRPIAARRPRRGGGGGGARVLPELRDDLLEAALDGAGELGGLAGDAVHDLLELAVHTTAAPLVRVALRPPPSLQHLRRGEALEQVVDQHQVRLLVDEEAQVHRRLAELAPPVQQHLPPRHVAADAAAVAAVAVAVAAAAVAALAVTLAVEDAAALCAPRRRRARGGRGARRARLPRRGARAAVAVAVALVVVVAVAVAVAVAVGSRRSTARRRRACCCCCCCCC